MSNENPFYFLNNDNGKEKYLITKKKYESIGGYQKYYIDSQDFIKKEEYYEVTDINKLNEKVLIFEKQETNKDLEFLKRYYPNINLNLKTNKKFYFL
eukprot:gene7715-12185_t